MVYSFSSLLGIVLAAVAQNVLGMLWYSPTLFGNLWMKDSNTTVYKDSPTFKKEMMKAQAYSVLVSLVTAAVMACFMTRMMIITPIAGILFGLTAWLGFVAPVTGQMVIWARHSIQAWMINNGFNAVSMAIMGLILVYFI